jgi:hypothetical protein
MRKFIKSLMLITLMLIATVAFNNCSGGFKAASSSSTSSSAACTVPAVQTNPNAGGTITTIATPTSLQGKNTISLSLGAGSINQVNVSITICVPGTSNCQTVSNLLLDTGSTGVRIFSSALSSSLYSNLPQTGLGNCTSYADNSYDWGPVVLANVQLGQETASSVPIQVIDNSYADGGASCVQGIKTIDGEEGITVIPSADSQSSGFNGIVGVNFLAQDCGSYCVSNADAYGYYCCSGSTCAPSTAALNVQMTNPISLLQYDNNGVMLNLPGISGTGASSSTGTMYVGIGTQPNNTPLSSVKTLTADSNENDYNFTMFYTTFQGQSISAFIDSGSGCLAFPFSNSSELPENSYGGFIPSTPVSLSATQVGINSVQAAVSFTIAAINNYNIQPECAESMGSSFASSDFDWGLPFFLGRKVYVGVEGSSSTLGSGLYWAW